MEKTGAGKTLSLDGHDWHLVHLVPREWESRQVWKEDWETGQTWPGVEPWIRGSVPGDVIADAYEAGSIPDPYVDMNSRACEWLAQRDWVYRKDFTGPVLPSGEVLRLCFDGVDHSCRVYLNGEFLGKHEGMNTPFEFIVTDKVRQGEKNRLVVVVMHAPPVEDVQGQVGRTSEARVWKARFAYSWDWCTRLIPVGIWRSVRLEQTGPVWISDLWARPRVDLSQGLEQPQAEIETSVSLRDTKGAAAGEVRIRVLGPDGSEVARGTASSGPDGKATVTLPVENPRLWWTRELGDQPLYTVEAQAAGSGDHPSHLRAASCGLRTIRLVPNEGAPADALPYTPEVNGRRIFIKGWNWVPVDHMYGRDQGDVPPAGHPVKDRYRRLVELASHARCNLLRIWGGGFLESEKLYDLCDREGILLWQEFPLSSSGINNYPPSDEDYLKYIEAEARQMVPLRRNHPSLALWCAGNELIAEDNTTPLSDSHPAIGRLKSVAAELDPDRAWLPTSASGPMSWPSMEEKHRGMAHDVHGPWMYDGPEKQYKTYNNIAPLLHSEFGVDGAANIATLRRFITPERLWPPDGTNSAWVHHGAWWLHRPRVEGMFGSVDNIDDFVKASQWIQAEGLRYAIEAHRRRTGLCSGTMPWQFNEAFPNATCTNAVDYLLQPKPAYWAIRRAYSPVNLSLKYAKLTWNAGEELPLEVWGVSGVESVDDAHWKVELFDLAGNRIAVGEGQVSLEARKPVHISDMKAHLPAEPGVVVAFVTLTGSDGTVLSRSDTAFPTGKTALGELLRAPEVNLRLIEKGNGLVIENECAVPALMVHVPVTGEVLPEDSYFCLKPGEGRMLFRKRPADSTEVTAWNSQPLRIGADQSRAGSPGITSTAGHRD